MVTRADVTELYVATFNRAPDSDGLDYWTSSPDFTIDMIAKTFFDQTETQELYPEGTTNEQFVVAVYKNLFDRLPDTAGYNYWVGQLDSGAISRSNAILTFINGAQSTDAEILANKAEVGLYYADQGGEGTFSLADIDATDDSVTNGKAAVDTAVAGETDYTLTADTDDFTGTSGDDSFDAPIVQNPWAGGVSNSLSTADEVDGGAGNDTLHAELVPEFFGVTGDNEMEVQPDIKNVEEITFEAMDVTTTEANKAITVDAKDITDVVKIGSKMSDGDLVIENVTTLTSTGSIRNTSELTVVMDHTDNFNSDNDASDLTVYFDEDYLVAGQSTAGSTLTIRMLNAVNNVENHNPIEGTSALDFFVGDTKVTVDISSIAADDTLDYTTAYDKVVDAINAQLAADGFTNVTAAKGTIEDAVFSIPVQTYSSGDDAGDYYPIIVTNAGSENLVEGQFQTTQLEYDTDQNNSMTDAEAQTSADPLSINVELEKVGRDGEGGDLIIGAKDQNLNGDSDVDQTDGIGIFNISVLGGEDKPSNLGTITSTNNSLDTVNVVSSQPEDDTYADLTVRTMLGQGQELTLINATGFQGDFHLGMSVINGVATVTGQQQALTSNFGAGDDSYSWVSVEADTNDDDGKDYSIDMGAGNDTVVVELDGDSVDALGESFSLVTGAGNDTVTVDMTSGVSFETMTEISANQDTYLDINTGSGDDRVLLNDYGTFDIVTADGDDYIEIDANDATDLSGQWAIFANTGADTFERVLYNAKLTVSFAGFETTIDIETTSATNFVATQAFLASEIQRAIESDDTLSEFLTVNIAAGTNQVTITSDIDGANVLGIALYQPELISTGTATAAQTLIESNDVSALRQGLLATETVANLSADLETAAEISAWVGANNWEGSVSQTGVGDSDVSYTAAQLTNDTAETVQDDANDILDLAAPFLAYSTGGSSNDTSGVNFSTINAGSGNDIIVLDSNVGSMNTIVVDGTFGYDRVVNFHDDTTDITDDAANEVGDHIIDYSHYLTDLVDTSDATGTNAENNDSAVLADTNVILATGARSFTGTAHGATAGNTIDANDVAVLRFDSSAADNASETFANLGASDVLNALNGDYDTTGDNAYANLTDALMSATAVADYVTATQNHIIMIENDLNEGEYKVFHVTSTIDTATNTVVDGDFATVTELGTFDFGASVNLAISQEESVMAALQAAIDAAVVAGGTSPTNHAPVATDDSFTEIANEASVLIDVLANDTDADSDALTIQSVSVDASQGTAVIENGQIRYTAATGFDGNVSFTYTVTDGTATDTATVTGSVAAAGAATDVTVDVTAAGTSTALDTQNETFDITVGNYAHTIADFDTANDKLDFGTGITAAAISITNTADDGQAVLSYSPDAGTTVVEITLTGLTSAEDAALTGEAGVAAILA